MIIKRKPTSWCVALAAACGLGFLAHAGTYVDAIDSVEAVAGPDFKRSVVTATYQVKEAAEFSAKLDIGGAEIPGVATEGVDGFTFEVGDSIAAPGKIVTGTVKIFANGSETADETREVTLRQGTDTPKTDAWFETDADDFTKEIAKETPKWIVPEDGSAEVKEGKIAIDADSEAPVSYKPDTETPEATVTRIETVASFDAVDTTTTVPEGAQAGIKMVEVEGVKQFSFLVNGEWVPTPVDGLTPDTGVDYAFRMEINYQDGEDPTAASSEPNVTYSVKLASESEFIEAANGPTGVAAKNISSVEMFGNGAVASINGEYDYMGVTDDIAYTEEAGEKTMYKSVAEAVAKGKTTIGLTYDATWAPSMADIDKTITFANAGGEPGVGDYILTVDTTGLSGYAAKWEGNTLTFIQSVQAEFDGEEYEKLADALAAAGAVGEGTVTLLANVTVGSVSIPAGVVLDPTAEHTLTTETLVNKGTIMVYDAALFETALSADGEILVADDLSTDVCEIPAGATVTVADGSLTIEDAGEVTIKADLIGNMTVVEGTVKLGADLSVDAGVALTAAAVEANGKTLTLEAGASLTTATDLAINEEADAVVVTDAEGKVVLKQQVGEVYVYTVGEPITTVTCTFDIGDATGVAPEPIVAEEGEDITFPTAATFSKDGYDFVGWAEEEGGEALYEPGEQVKMADADATFYAAWQEKQVEKVTLTINQVANGTIVVSNATAEVVSGTQFDKSAAVELTVYRTPADGYQLAAGCLAVESITMNQDQTVTAVFEQATPSYPEYVDPEHQEAYNAWATKYSVTPEQAADAAVAFALDCDPTDAKAIQDARDAFQVSISVVDGEVNVTVLPVGKKYNIAPVVLGSETVDGAYAPKKAGDKFFKAEIKLPNED